MRIDVPRSARARVVALLDDYFAAPDDADIEVRTGATGHGEAAVLITVGKTHHGLTVAEARVLASIAEKTMNTLPKDNDARSLPNLILALRTGAEFAEKPGAPRNDHT